MAFRFAFSMRPGAIYWFALLTTAGCGCGGRTRVTDDMGDVSSVKASATGGTRSALGSSQGGASSTGGTVATSWTTATGASGGQAALGGAPSGGGNSLTSVFTGIGGKSANGGSQPVGSSNTTGGVMSSGGTSAFGGTSAAGDSIGSGGTFATGGTLMMGGVSATGGTSALGGGISMASLAGHYDLFIDPPSSVEGCSATFSESRVNLTIVREGSVDEVYAYSDFDFRGYPGPGWKLNDNALGFMMLPASGHADDDGPQVTLDVGAQGFTGLGTANVTYVCDSGSKITLAVGVRLLPDRTPPRLRLQPMLSIKQGSALAFTEFRPEFSELMDLGSYRPHTMFFDLERAADTVYVIDAGDTQVLDVEWLPGMGGGESVLRLRDSQSLVNHSLQVRLSPPGLADPSGNEAVPVDDPWLLLASVPVGSVYDFDVMPSSGLYGNAHYENSDGGGTLCESGGCVVLEGAPAEVNSYWGRPFPQAMLGLNFLSTDGGYYKIRCQLWANRTDVFIMQKYPTDCTGWRENIPLLASADSTEPYHYQSGWIDDTIGTCYGPDRDRGIALTFGCENCDPKDESTWARLVIERIEVTDSPY